MLKEYFYWGDHATKIASFG